MKPLYVEMPLRIQGYDIDVMGIVSNIVYIRWFEDLRYEFLEAWLPYRILFADGLSPIIYNTEAFYLQPLHIHDRPVGSIWMTELGRARWTVGFEIRCGDTLHCRGHQTGAILDLKRQRPARIPAALRDQYDAALQDAVIPWDFIQAPHGLVPWVP